MWCLRFVTLTFCDLYVAATFSYSYVKWCLRYVMLRFVAVPKRNKRRCRCQAFEDESAVSESIERFIEDQAFSAPHPPPSSPLPSAIFLSFLVFHSVAGRAYCQEWGQGAGVEPNHTIPRKPGPPWSFNTLCSCTLYKGLDQMEVKLCIFSIEELFYDF